MKLLNITKLLMVLGMICGLNQNAHAQAEKIGNGGRSVVCSSSAGSLQSAELMDLYEGRTIRGINVDPALLALNRDVAFDLISKKILELDVFKGPKMVEIARTALSDIKVIESGANISTKLVRFLNDHVARVDDSYEIFIPKSCMIEQFIVQKTPVFPEDRLLNIQKDIWNAMKPIDQVASLFHEALLYVAVNDFGATSSVGVRYLVSQLFNSELISIQEYYQFGIVGGFYKNLSRDLWNKPSQYQWSKIPNDYLTIQTVLKPFADTEKGKTVFIGKCILLLRDSNAKIPMRFEYEKWIYGWDEIVKMISSGKCDE